MPRRVEFTVSGSGEFPADMLRYDACWPRRQEDVTEAFPGGPRPRLERRSVGMASHKLPTVGRWESFGWSVSDERQV
jgi:hypothetical protein